MNRILGLVKQEAAAIFEDVVAWRRKIHAHPELSMDEKNTAALVCNVLDSLNIEYTSHIAGYGVVALITGEKPGKGLVALRADMDALPMSEASEVSYCSQIPGVMHACGHDVHTAMLLGVAHVLHRLRQEWGGSVKLIFQPSEEQHPGGASLMIGEGVLDNPRPDVIVGQHVQPDIPVGKIGIRKGRYMASTDELFLTVKGKGGHGALPHELVDPVLISAHIIVALQQVVSRMTCPSIPTVLSFGRIIGEGLTNVIPDKVEIQGILRTFDEQWRGEALQRVENLARSVAQGMGGDIELRISHGYPVLYNDEEVTQRVKEYAVAYVGRDNVVNLDVRMTAEDFAFYSQIMPASFYRLGAGNIDLGVTSGLHTSRFDVDEKCMETGVGFMVWSALNELNKKNL